MKIDYWEKNLGKARSAIDFLLQGNEDIQQLVKWKALQLSLSLTKRHVVLVFGKFYQNMEKNFDVFWANFLISFLR